MGKNQSLNPTTDVWEIPTVIGLIVAMLITAVSIPPLMSGKFQLNF